MSPTRERCGGCGTALRESDRSCPFCGHASDQPGHDPPTPPEVPPARIRGPWAVNDAEARASDLDAIGTRLPPWEDRARFGIWSALWLTWRDSVLKPVPFFRSLPPRGGLGSTLSYVLLFFVLSALLGYYWGTVEAVLSGRYVPGTPAAGVSALFGFLVGLALIVPVYLGLLFALVALLHLGYRIAGEGRMGFEASFRAVAYAHGPAAFAVFPFFGNWLGLIWASVLVFIGTREVHRTTNGRAALAFLLPALAVVILMVALAVVVALLVDPYQLIRPD